MKHTIKSIAEELNLSRNTVAKVLSGKDGVSQKTKKLVLEKIKELEVPEPVPQRTVQPSSDDAVLLLIPEHAQHADFRKRLIQTLENELPRRGYQLVTEVLKTSESTISESSEPVFRESPTFVLPEIVFHTTVKGIIVAGVSSTALCDQLCKLPVPVSIIDFSKSCLPYKGRFDLITLDTTTALQQAASIFQSDSIQNITLQSPIEQMGTAAVRCVTDRIREPLLPHVYMEYIPSLVFGSSSAHQSDVLYPKQALGKS